MSRILVITGGPSDERAVSLRSGAAVAQALEACGHHVTSLDLNDGYDRLVAAAKAVDLVFPALHGAGGEDGKLQAVLEKHTIAFVGSGSEASALCFDKKTYHAAVGNSIKLPESMMVTVDTYMQSNLAKKPFVLKPVDGGSSIGVHLVHTVTDIPYQAIEESFAQYGHMLMEQLIFGVELTVGVLGEEAIGIAEIIPPEQGWFDYENKYNGTSQELCPPKHLSQATQEKALELALTAHQLTNCRDLSRTDMIYETLSDELYVLETNTLPGMTSESLYPKIAANHGLAMSELCDKLVSLAVKHQTDAA